MTMDFSYESGTFYQLTTVILITLGIYGIIKERRKFYNYNQIKPFFVLGLALFFIAIFMLIILPGRWDYDHVKFILSLQVDERSTSYYRLFLALSYFLLVYSAVSAFIVKENKRKGIDFPE